MVDVIIAEKMSDEKLRSLIYQGAIIVFRRVPAIAVLCEMAETMARETTKIDDPPLAHRLYDREQFAEVAAKLQLRYATDSRIRRFWIEGLREAGVDSDYSCVEGST